MTSTTLSAAELDDLIHRVFAPDASERSILILVDLPDRELPDNEDWAQRREIAAGWARTLAEDPRTEAFTPTLCLYRNVRANNADLPASAWIHPWSDPLPRHADEPDPGAALSLPEILQNHPMALAPTELSATAPLKMLAPRLHFRAATMPGFGPAMVGALRLDYGEVNRRVNLLKDLLDRAQGADLLFAVDSAAEHRLHLDLRYRTAHASGGVLRETGIAGNLPSGEAYIVPYEGEVDGQRSLSEGRLPVQFSDEVVLYQIEANRATQVLSTGVQSRRQAEALEREPAYGNLAELGLGVLDDFGLEPIGEVLLDEKLGLHIAFGRSEHFGGQVGPQAFSRPEAVVHQDHVYIPKLQPRINPASVVLQMDDGSTLQLMEDGRYVIDFREHG